MPHDPTAPYDVLIIGGGFAGLSAALYTARGMRRGVLCTAGPSRNAAAGHTHGFLTQDGANPAEVLQTARAQLAQYELPIIETEVVQVTGQNNAFTAHLADGRTLQARKLILATGVQDILPDIPGLQAEWGRGVQHCPYCYGWEVSDQPLALYQPGLSGTDGIQTILYHQKLSDDFLVCSDGPLDFTPEQRHLLEDRGATLIDSALVRVEGIPEGVRLHFADGTSAERVVLYTHGERRLRAELAEALGCEMTAAGIKIDPQNHRTTVPGVYAAGDVSSGNQVAFAVAGGGKAAMQVGFEIYYDDLPAWARG